MGNIGINGHGCFEGSGKVWGTRGSDGRSKAGMSCGENLAEASMRDRGCGSAWWTRGWWRALVIEDRDLNTRQ